jgi:hypothetical protein
MSYYLQVLRQMGNAPMFEIYRASIRVGKTLSYDVRDLMFLNYY